MRTFKAYFKKEIIESIRNYKYLVLAIGLLVFAVLDPIMLKMLPSILKSQIPIDLGNLFKIDRVYGITNYIKDLYQIGLLVVVFTFSGTLGEEIWGHKLVFPYSRGASPKAMVLAKFFHHILAIIILVFLGFIINYYYVSVLFTGGDININKILTSAALISAYYAFSISLLLYLSSLFKKSVFSGILVLFICYLLGTLSFVDKIKEFSPYVLITCANKLSFQGSIKGLVTTFVISLIFIMLTMYRLKKAEVI